MDYKNQTINHTASYHSGHPDPQKYRSDYVLLNGDWKFVFDEGKEGILNHYEKQFPENYLKINVPYAYQSPASGINLPEKQCDVIWYEREISIDGADKTYIVRFNGVDYKTTVFVNGEYVMQHEGGYDGFAVDVTQYVQMGNNKITLRIEDEMDLDQIRGKQRWRKKSFACFYTETSGIVRDVYMEILDKIHIDDFSLVADYDHKTLTVSVKAPADTCLAVELSDKDGVAVKSEKYKLSGENDEFCMCLEHVIGWSVENPYLYNLKLTLEHDGKVKDKILSYCGFVSVKTENKRFYINGKDTYLKFVLNQGYWTDTISTPTEQEIVDDIKLTIDCGFNGARMHEHIPSPLNFYYMDLYGLYAWQECPSAGAYSYKACKQYFKQFPRLITEHISHPCIIAYVLFNESWGIDAVNSSDEIQEVTEKMYNLVKAMVGNRLVISNDGWEHTVSDVITFHNYLETYDQLSSFLNKGLKTIMDGGNAECLENSKDFFAGNYRYCGQPIMFSEFAGIAFVKDEDSGWGYGKGVETESDFLGKYGDMLRFIEEHSEMRGFCMTQLTDVYQEKNGLFTMARKEKVPVKVLKTMHDKFN